MNRLNLDTGGGDTPAIIQIGTNQLTVNLWLLEAPESLGP